MAHPLADTLAGRVALVTGGSGGIGRALVHRLAAAGVHVAVGYRRNADAAHDAVTAAEASGVRAVAVGADLADQAAVADLVDAVESHLGPIDVLVANAGTAPRAELADVDLAMWRRTIDVNLTAPFLLAQRAVPGMTERRWGRIAFVSSVAAFMGGVVGPHYASSKSALHGLTHYLAGRLAPVGVTVNAIAPALIADTAMLPIDREDQGRMPLAIPVGRLGTPDEVADLTVAVLANPYLTNQVIGLDGGLYPR